MELMTFIELLKGGYELIKSTIPAFDFAYNRALKKWTVNRSLREKWADNYLGDYDKLVKYIQDPNSVSPVFREFFEILYNEVKNDPKVSIILNTDFTIKDYQLSQKIKEDTEHIQKEQDKHTELLMDIRSMISSLTQFAPKIYQKYEDVEGYIPLKVRREENEQDAYKRIFYGNDSSKSIDDLIIEGSKRLILFSDPQHGKSTVLAKLAFDLQQSELYRPFLFNLRNYSSASLLETQIKLSDRLDNSSSSVLILDGLDELKEADRDNVISEISTISMNYPLMNIVLSCRMSHKTIMTLNGFEDIYLQSMSYDSIVSYIQCHCSDPETFLSNARDSQIMQLLYVPFFLKESISYFETHKSIPLDKVTIYEHFINRCFQEDQGRKIARSGFVSPKVRLTKHLEHIAFSMLTSQQMEISADELFEDLGINHEVIEELIGISLITKGDNGGFTFVHNAFKEYILAKKLSTLGFVQIKQLVCYPETAIIIPALKNVVVLTIHLICKSPLWDKSNFQKWFIEEHPWLLVEVGPECLDKNTREIIFMGIYNEHRRKGLHIDYGRVESLMKFSSTQQSARYIVSEIENSESIDVNCMNALRLAEYTDFSLLSEKELEHAREVFLSLLKVEGQKMGKYSYISFPFHNSSLQTPEFLEEVKQQINDTTNCYLIQLVCSMAVSLGLADEYVDWALTKAEYVRNYEDNGATHVVSDHELMEHIRALRNPQNIIKALRFILPSENYHARSHYEKDRLYIIPTLLQSLATTQDASIWEEVITIIDTSDTNRMPRNISDAFGEYLKKNTDTNILFDKRLGKVIESGKEEAKDYFKFMEMHNLLSILMTEERLLRIIEDDKNGCYDASNIMFRMREYSARNEQELALISDYITKKFPDKYAESVIQKEFNILFDREAFKDEIIKIFDGNVTLDFGRDARRIYFRDYNSSVIWFLQELTGASDIIKIEDALNIFNDTEQFSIYVIGRIPVSGSDRIVVSRSQYAEIARIIHCYLPIYSSQINPCYLINIIVRYDIKLSDEELISLLAWSGMETRDPDYDGISSINRPFIDYIYEHLENKYLIVNEVKKVLKTDAPDYLEFYEGIAKYIIKYKISELYESFRDIISRFSSEYAKINITVKLLKLGDIGYEIVMSFIDMLSETDRLCFYEHLLLYENKDLVLTDKMIKESIEYIDINYDTYTDEMKQRAVKILFAYGMDIALDRGIEMFDRDDSWIFVEHFPTTTKFSGKHFEKLAIYFKLATEKKGKTMPRPQPMYESVASTLRSIAMESIEMLGKVKEVFRSIANSNSDYCYYNIIADGLDTDYYSKNVPIPSLNEASQRYRSIFRE